MNSKRESMKVEVASCLEQALNNLQTIWAEIGISESSRSERENVVLLHIRNLLEEMVSEEQDMRTKLLVSIEESGKELYKLSQELKMQPYEADEGLTVLQLEKALRLATENLTKQKEIRMTELKDLKDVEQHLCDALCTTPYYIPTGSIPSKEQLETLQEHINTLKAERESRQTTYTATKKEILTLLNDLEQGPNTSFERDIVCEEEDSFLLSKDNMEALQVLQSELITKQEENSRTADQIRDRITSLWNRLMVPEDERHAFLEQNEGCRPSTIKMLEEESTRLDILKMQNIEKVIQGSRDELQVWWDKCYYSREQRNAFDGFYDDNFTEELLEQHDQQLASMKTYYEHNQEILGLVKKREEMWKIMLQFEKRANDPNRFFSNRGGKLLMEEKERKKINRDLPKLEQSLSDRIEEYEESQGCPFLVDGCRFKDYVETQWVAHEAEKAMAKTRRLEAKKKETEIDMKFGSKPGTPAKRPRLPSGSATNTPASCKRRKGQLNGTNVAPSPRWCSSTISMSPASKKPPRGTSAFASMNRTPRKLRNTPARNSQRKALGDKNTTSNLFSTSTVSGSSVANTVNMSESIASNCTTYSDFAKELDSGSRENLRSSILPSPKGPKSFSKSRIGLY